MNGIIPAKIALRVTCGATPPSGRNAAIATGGDRNAVCRFNATSKPEEQRVDAEVRQQRQEDRHED